jgi:predicted nuclease of predicted toxin-antitoxin system
MVIVSKDADFSDRVMLSDPPPRVVHVRLGNMRMREFHAILSQHWPWVLEHVSQFRLIRIYADRIEGVGAEA